MLYLCIYDIYIYVCVHIYYTYIWIKNNKKIFKVTIFLFFSEALSMCKKIANENTDNSPT